MPVDYYIGKSVEELSKLLSAAQARKAKGNISEVTAAGVRTVRDFSQNRRVEQEIFDLRYSLYRRALGTPEASIWTDPRLERVTRTRVNYIDSSAGEL